MDISNPSAPYMMLVPGVGVTELAASLAAARQTIGGPNGQIAVPGHDGR